MDKILTVIIPSYNMEGYLDKCLQSLICASLSLMDIIVVNDGSTDRTVEIARQYEKKYVESIRVIDKPNGNYGSCINTALPIAKGKYIKILDADDCFKTSNLDGYLAFLYCQTADIIITDYQIVNASDTVTSTITFNFPQETTVQIDEIFRKVPLTHFEMHCITYHRRVFERIDYHQTEGISYTDQEWMFIPMTAVLTAYYHPIIIYRYLVGREGQTINSDRQHKMVKQTLQVVSSMANYYSSQQIEPNSVLERYLIKRMFVPAIAIYRIMLVKSSGFERDGTLITFDKQIETQVPILSRQLETETIGVIPFHFIKYWRLRIGSVSRFRMLRLFQALYCIMKIVL